jgi:hypothetical protein
MLSIEDSVDLKAVSFERVVRKDSCRCLLVLTIRLTTPPARLLPRDHQQVSEQVSSALHDLITTSQSLQVFWLNHQGRRTIVMAYEWHSRLVNRLNHGCLVVFSDTPVVSMIHTSQMQRFQSWSPADSWNRQFIVSIVSHQHWSHCIYQSTSNLTTIIYVHDISDSQVKESAQKNPAYTRARRYYCNDTVPLLSLTVSAMPKTSSDYQPSFP